MVNHIIFKGVSGIGRRTTLTYHVQNTLAKSPSTQVTYLSALSKSILDDLDRVVHMNFSGACVIVVDYAALLDKVTWKRILSVCGCCVNITFVLDINVLLDPPSFLFESAKFHVEEIKSPLFEDVSAKLRLGDEDKLTYDESQSLYKTCQTRTFRSIVSEHNLNSTIHVLVHTMESFCTNRCSIERLVNYFETMKHVQCDLDTYFVLMLKYIRREQDDTKNTKNFELLYAIIAEHLERYTHEDKNSRVVLNSLILRLKELKFNDMSP